jgi:hypothetical protein
MSRQSRKVYGFTFIILLLFISFVTCADDSTIRTTDRNIPGSLQHMDAQVFNDYIAALVKNKEPEMKTALVNEGQITDFKLLEAKFEIMTGKLFINFLLYYKNIDIKGALNFEIRVSADPSPQVGGCCLGIEGGLHSSKFFTDVILALVKNMINKRLVGRQFWSDNKPHSEYKTFNNDNLAYIVNQSFINNQAGSNQFKQITIPTDIGTLEAEFKNIRCDELDISAGRAKVSFDIGASLKSVLGLALNFENAGTASADFDIYIDCDNRSWWVKLSSIKLTINGLAPEINAMAQDLITNELNARKILIQIDMPKMERD